MKTELCYYDIYPKVVPAGAETQITIRPLGWHAAFPGGCTLAVCPLDEGSPDDYPSRANAFQQAVSPGPDGCVRFVFKFFGEQEFYIRITGENNFKVQMSVFAVSKDLVGRYPFRGDLHMHTRRSDGREAPEIVCANYRKTAGYDFLAITDHHRYYPSLDAIAAYKDVRIEMALIPGEEVHMPKGPGHINDIHIVNFGGDYSVNALVENRRAPEILEKPRSISPNPPSAMRHEEYWRMIDAYADTLNIPEGIDKFAYASCHWIFQEIRRANGLGIFCHPYWLSDVFQVPPQFVAYMMKTHPFDAFEVLGGETYFEQNGLQTLQYYEDRAKGRAYPVVGSTDSHGSVDNPKAHICSTIVFARENEKLELVSAIKEGYSVAVDSISPRHSYVGEMRFARYACFLENEFFPLHDELCFEEGRAMKGYVCGDPAARDELAFLYGRVKAQREKYFAF